MTHFPLNLGQFAYFDTLLNHPIWKGKKVLDFGGNIGNLLMNPDSTIEENQYWCMAVDEEAIAIGKKNILKGIGFFTTVIIITLIP